MSMLEAVCVALGACVLALAVANRKLCRRVDRIETAFQTAADRLEDTMYEQW